MLFLGAGASTPLGYPVMAEFVKRVREEIQREGNESRHEEEAKLLTDLMFRGGYNDIEEVLVHIEKILSLTQDGMDSMWQDTLPKISPLGRQESIGFRQLTANALSLRQYIENSIFDVYQLFPEVQDKLEFHKELFLCMHQADSQGTTSAPRYVFTTNYDRVIEEFCRLQQYDLRNGFRVDPVRQNRKLWWPASFDEPLLKDRVCVKLFKLHGSLSWKKAADGHIEELSVDLSFSGKPPRMYEKKDLLIYPASKTPPDDEPLRTLYDKFETEMNEAGSCLVVGFSFRDPYLNRIFREFAGSGRHQLFVMGKNCRENVANNLLKDKEALEIYTNDGRIVLVERNLSEQGWAEELKKALKAEMPGSFKGHSP